MNIPFEMGYTFDENLREKPISLAEMKQGIVFLKEHLHEDSLYGKSCGLIGVYERIAGNLSESKYYLQEAIENYTQTDNIQGLFINKPRLAHTYHWERKFPAANALFTELLQTLPDLPAYEDFFYQHYGKSKLDEGYFHTALSYFQKALQIRLQKGNEELIHSTKLCITYCMSHR
ncbi:hypothetical protein DN389_03360 [Bacillus sp. AY3-1]|uniref:Tetratricopeptide repeat protein n=1 Tax=Bacillus wiedmannii TaxID=1890302 RepID=A0A1C4G7S9_9BACI|nr:MULTISPECIES: hypothetical protein [Bacillus cereus group]KAA0749617.1 hypothetical protein DN389_03360 [Bacillus sp. AY3-1]MCP9281608.1 hypothetical protein [Bacillus wiedmannii]MCU5093868.1 hypothetical protein [Bacillus wiedmannii]PEP18033.1 hypothetical protein CN552_04280 [Bacillus wiedmannii]PHB07894.1 hypothetical protein COE81_08725 [Bacillus wiedmannii]